MLPGRHSSMPASDDKKVVVAALSLGLGIGANTSIWSAVDQLLLRPLPFPEEERLVRVHSTNRERGWTETRLSRPDLEDPRVRSRSLDLTGVVAGDVTVVGAAAV